MQKKVAILVASLQSQQHESSSIVLNCKNSCVLTNLYCYTNRMILFHPLRDRLSFAWCVVGQGRFFSVILKTQKVKLYTGKYGNFFLNVF